MLIAAWTNFFGANTRLSARRLPEGAGVSASNIRLGSADLRPWNAPATVVTTGGATALISAYRMDRATVSDIAEWLQWSMDVDVVRSLVANDTLEEIYYTGDGAPKMTNHVLALPAIPGPAAWRYLGIPKPSAQMDPPTVLVAGTGTTESRAYIDTFMDTRNRESAPGIPRSFSCLAGSTADLTGLAAPTGSGHDINRRRIYCSTDGGEYLLVVEQSSALTAAVDDLSRGAILQSGGDESKPAWEEPPVTTFGIIDLWNGMIGAVVAKKSYGVCEPNKPWAWPVQYQETVADDIVATGKWLQNWLILTTSHPFLVTGSSPLSMSNQPIPFNQACVSKRSVVGMGHGVCWASPDGLCYMGQGGPRLLTEALMSPEQWQALVPSTIIGSRVERFYIGFYNDGSAKGFLIDPVNPQGIVFLTFGARGVYYDPISTRLYLQDTGNTIKRWGAGSALTASFKTPIKRLPEITNPGFGQVISDVPTSVAVKLWANLLQPSGAMAWVLVFDATVATNQPFALPGGYLSQEFQAEISTTTPVQGLVLVEDINDLP